MKLFLGYLIFSLVVGIKLWDRPPIWRYALLGGVGLAVCFAYLFFEQI